jgi:predicted RNA-binding Zn-ribbon protein involved in translation (DUF1610 family)
MTVVEFRPRTTGKDVAEDTEYQNGPVRCMACRHEWHARAPVGVWQFECPSCGCDKGVWAGFVDVAEGDSFWRCDCGGDIYRISSEGTFCIICGSWHSFD